LLTRLLNSKSISARFSVSLVAGVLRAVIAFSTAMLLARWLGPDQYGRIVFLVATHAAVRQFFDMGTSSAYFTFLSQRTRSRYFVLVFWGWLLIQLIVLVLLVAFIMPQELFSKMWLDEKRDLVLLALISSFMQGSVWQAAAQLGEAIRETSRVQLAGLAALLTHLLLITAAWLFNALTINFIFMLVTLEWTLASIYIYKLHHTKIDSSSSKKPAAENFVSIFNEYKYYCIPLIPLAWLGAAHDFADRWMLQTWSGSKEQAYFGVAVQISGISLLVTTAILRIFWKEIAEAHQAGNFNKVGALYSKLLRMLFFFGAFLSAGMIPWSSDILFLTAGEAYLDGSFTFALMLIYPIHQCLGQVTNTLFYATSNTKMLFWINSAFLILGMLLTYIILAPKDALIPGLNLSSAGLAGKLLFMQLIFVNLAYWLISRKYDWPLQFLYQFVILVVCLVASFTVYWFVLKVFYFLPILVQLSLFLGFYILLIIRFGSRNLHFIGLTPDDVAVAKNTLKGFINSR